MTRLRLKTAATLLALSGAALLAGCGIAALPGAAGAVPATKTESKGTPKYDVDPQVIYRIDDHRYVTLENYPSCVHKDRFENFGQVFYRDDNLGIKTELPSGFAVYQGRLILDAVAGKNLAFPASPAGYCGEKGGGAAIAYSTDQGRTWQRRSYIDQGCEPAATKGYTVVVTDSALYVYQDQRNVSKPVGGRMQFIPSLPGGLGGEERGIPVPVGLKTPSGMDHIVCDPSIKPRGVTYVDPNARLKGAQ